MPKGANGGSLSHNDMVIPCQALRLLRGGDMEIGEYISSFVRVKVSPTKELKDYYINSDGDIIGVKRKRMQLLKPKLSNNGYLTIGLRDETGNRQHYFVHRLVAFTFLVKSTSKYDQVNHIDGNKLNNSVRNLEWTTQRGNTIHAYKSRLIKDVLKPCRVFKDGVEIATTDSKKGVWEIISRETGYHTDYIRKQVNNPNTVCEKLKHYSYVCI